MKAKILFLLLSFAALAMAQTAIQQEIWIQELENAINK